MVGTHIYERTHAPSGKTASSNTRRLRRPMIVVTEEAAAGFMFSIAAFANIGDIFTHFSLLAFLSIPSVRPG